MKKRLFALLMAVMVMVTACSSGGDSRGDNGPQPTPELTGAEVDTVESDKEINSTLEAEAMALRPRPAVPVVLQPQAPGLLSKACDVAVIDYSNTADGYVMVQYTGDTQQRLKVRVSKETTYTYNLTPGRWTAFPLSDGNGNYKVTVYRNVRGNEYTTVMSAAFPVALADEFAPFIRPNQYVNYSDSPATMDMGSRLCTGKETTLEKVAAVYDYVVDNFTYDYDKARTVKSGYLPQLDHIMDIKTGICFDYAAVMTAMLRSQQVPCKLVVGYAGDIYHAWINVWTEDSGWVDGAIFFDGSTWRRMDPTFASSSNRSDEIMDFIENGSYTVKYLY